LLVHLGRSLALTQMLNTPIEVIVSAKFVPLLYLHKYLHIKLWNLYIRMSLKNRSQRNSTNSKLRHASILATATQIRFRTSTVKPVPIVCQFILLQVLFIFSSTCKSLISSMYNYTGCIVPLSVIVSPSHLFKILDPDPQYFQKDHFRKKK